MRAEGLNFRQLHGRKGTAGVRKEKEANISHWEKHHGYLLLLQPLEQPVMKNTIIASSLAVIRVLLGDVVTWLFLSGCGSQQ